MLAARLEQKDAAEESKKTRIEVFRVIRTGDDPAMTPKDATA